MNWKTIDEIRKDIQIYLEETDLSDIPEDADYHARIITTLIKNGMNDENSTKS